MKKKKRFQQLWMPILTGLAVLALLAFGIAEYFTLLTGQTDRRRFLALGLTVAGIASLGVLLAIQLIKTVMCTEREKERLTWEAERDGLTGLLCKKQTELRMARCLSSTHEGAYALFFMDIDDLKGINDAYGHAAGDAVIALLACEMQDLFGADTILGRVGGDEFAALLPAERERAQELAQTLLTRLSSRRADGAVVARLNISIGIVMIDQPDMPYVLACERADQAMYAAKRMGSGQYVFFDGLGHGGAFA